MYWLSGWRRYFCAGHHRSDEDSVSDSDFGSRRRCEQNRVWNIQDALPIPCKPQWRNFTGANWRCHNVPSRRCVSFFQLDKFTWMLHLPNLIKTFSCKKTFAAITFCCIENGVFVGKFYNTVFCKVGKTTVRFWSLQGQARRNGDAPKFLESRVSQAFCVELQSRKKINSGRGQVCYFRFSRFIFFKFYICYRLEVVFARCRLASDVLCRRTPVSSCAPQLTPVRCWQSALLDTTPIVHVSLSTTGVTVADVKAFTATKQRKTSFLFVLILSVLFVLQFACICNRDERQCRVPLVCM